MEQTYEYAIAEVLDILNHTKIEDVKRIPPKVITIYNNILQKNMYLILIILKS